MSRRTKYRYIGNGHCKQTDPISNYRLVGACKLHTFLASSYVRVKIPDDMVLEKWSCDEYSTTDDTRTIQELGYDIVVKINSKWKVMNELKHILPCDISKYMFESGYMITKEHGYLAIDDYKTYHDDLQKAIKKSINDAKETKRKLDAGEIMVDMLDYLDKKQILRILGLYVNEKMGGNELLC